MTAAARGRAVRAAPSGLGGVPCELVADWCSAVEVVVCVREVLGRRESRPQGDFLDVEMFFVEESFCLAHLDGRYVLARSRPKRLGGCPP